MRASLAMLCVAIATMSAFSAETTCHARFGADAFNRAVAVAAKGTTVFSPLSFEVDSVALSDAFDPITKAHFAEKIGVLSDFEAVYGQILGYLSESTASNKFYFVSARAMCLPDIRMASVPYRHDIQRLYSAEICPSTPKDGAQSWLRAMLNGDMEDFDIPIGGVGRGRYAFYDLASVKFSWQEPFPLSSTRKIAFTTADGKRTEVEAICDVRKADLWENRRFKMIRLPLADDAWFYAMMPNGDLTLSDIRAEFSSTKIDDIFAMINSVTVTGVYHGPVDVAIPKMDVTSTVDLVGVFGYFRFPLKGFARLDSNMRPVYAKQRVRFKLDEHGLYEGPLAEKRSEDVINSDENTKRFVLDKPFLFFIFHEPTGTMPLAGQFTGR